MTHFDGIFFFLFTNDSQKEELLPVMIHDVESNGLWQKKSKKPVVIWIYVYIATL